MVKLMKKKAKENVSWWTLAVIPLALLGIWIYATTAQLRNKPVTVQPDTQAVLVYFAIPTATDFDFVAVERNVPKTSGPNELALAAIQEWIKGPTEGQQTQGMTNGLNPDVRVNSMDILNGRATIDFNDKFNTPMGGSARVKVIGSSIEKMMKQFGVDGMANIKLTINNGERAAVLEP